MTFINTNRFPSNGRILVDSNIFLYSALAHKKFGKTCTEFLSRVENEDIIGFVPTIVIQEVLHRLMITEVQKKTGITNLIDIRKRIQTEPEIIQSLTQCFKATQNIQQMGFHLIGDSPEIITHSIEISKKYSLFAKDALIVASAWTYGIFDIASHDKDFERVPRLNVYSPITEI